MIQLAENGTGRRVSARPAGARTHPCAETETRTTRQQRGAQAVSHMRRRDTPHPQSAALTGVYKSHTVVGVLDAAPRAGGLYSARAPATHPSPPGGGGVDRGVSRNIFPKMTSDGVYHG